MNFALFFSGRHISPSPVPLASLLSPALSAPLAWPSPILEFAGDDPAERFAGTVPLPNPVPLDGDLPAPRREDPSIPDDALHPPGAPMSEPESGGSRRAFDLSVSLQ